MAERQATEAESRVIMMALGTVFLVAGLGLGGYGVSLWRQGKATGNWPTVQGTVTHSDIRHQGGEGGDTGSGTYIADVRYTYTVDGVTHEGNAIGLGEFGVGGTGHARERAGRYPVGAAVTVYVNPADPAHAVLEPGWGWILAIPLGLGVCLVPVGLFLLGQARAQGKMG